MITRSTSQVLCILNRLIDSGALKSSVDNWMECIRRDSRSFYKDEFLERGFESAEALLAEIVRKRGLREFSETIEPIAVGMRNILLSLSEKKSNTYALVVKEGGVSLRFPVCFREDTALVIVLYGLPQHEGWCCMQPDGAKAFGWNGSLPLKALLLIESHCGDHELRLVFPARNDSVGVIEGGYTTISVSRDGHVNGETLVSHVTADGLLAGNLGISPVDRMLGLWSVSGGCLDERLGFPGAEEYLRKHLPELGPYLSAISLIKHE